MGLMVVEVEFAALAAPGRPRRWALRAGGTSLAGLDPWLALVRGVDGGLDDACNRVWAADQRQVAGLDDGDLRAGVGRHCLLLGRGYHAVGGADQRPGWDRLPCRRARGAGIDTTMLAVASSA